MKTRITIFKVFLSLAAFVLFFSCDNPITLGKRLDVEGPIVSITSHKQRQTVSTKFDLEGNASDYTGVDELLVTATINNETFQRQWRYQKNAWQISNDGGKTWSAFANAAWNGTDNSVLWKVPVDMQITAGQQVNDGEYTFNVQAWDKGGFTDNKSSTFVVLIIDTNPPKVTVTNPYLYDKYAYADQTSDFGKLAALTGKQWKDPAYLGKFITQDFELKWQIEDEYDVKSIDLRFYLDTEAIDDNPNTPLPDNYIYRYYETLPSNQPSIDLNGTAIVPNLDKSKGSFGDGELKTPIPDKTIVKVVALCWDAANNSNTPTQEKTLGYFISWPEANNPWITFTDGMTPPDESYGLSVSRPDNVTSGTFIEDTVFTVYPGRSIKATAFQAQGVKNVKYSLYELYTDGNILRNPDSDGYKTTIATGEIILNPPGKDGKTYSTIFPWEFPVPVLTGYYIFDAEAFSSQGTPSEKYRMLFRVHDITFPDFVEGPLPIASDPLFMEIKNGKIKISGTVSDATDVRSLCLVWINPDSRNFAAMSQLSYFRNSDYQGWKEVLKLLPGQSMIEIPVSGVPEAEYPYDKTNPNKLWRLELTPAGIDNETNRHLFKFSQEIDIKNDMKIGPGSSDRPLKSQVFLLRAQNPDGKCTIVTYAPQGDTLAPVISVTNVVLNGNISDPYMPNEYSIVPQFADGNTITINGTWWEDSVAYLDIQQYFLNNIEITLNNLRLPQLSISDITVEGDKQRGTWSITRTVGSGANQISKDKLKDTLVIGVKARDIGGNEAETGCSWLIESDNLRLMRISSDTEDGIYKAGDKINIFLEFSKPVLLTNGSLKPELILSSNGGNNPNTARAVYKAGQVNYSSRQYFEYTVIAGDATASTGVNQYLNVTGLYYNTVYTATSAYNIANYPFTWSTNADNYEEVRITMQPGKKEENKEGTAPKQYYVRTLPTNNTPGNSDYQFTLPAGKHIEIDTTAPQMTAIAAASSVGHYQSGNIYITVTFDSEVILGATTPYLTLSNVTNTTTTAAQKRTDTSNVRVSGKTITFMYNIKSGDTTNGSAITIANPGGSITDLAGNALTGGISGTLSGLFIDTLPLPNPPVIRVLSANNISNPIGNSGAADVDLKNLYNSNLWFAIERGDSGGGSHRVNRLEYSINGGSWIKAANITNAPFIIDSITGGSYSITARQVTESGIISTESKAVKFYWDPGDFITRITSTSANGTYTNNSNRQDTVYITVSFRKEVKFSTASPTITINTTTPKTVAAAYTLNNAVTELTFNYAVGTTDNTSGKLDVTAFNLNGSTATDAAGVNINAYLGLANLPSDSRLSALKDITILTGALSVTTAARFIDSQVTPNGIQTDGSYNTALVIDFNKPIVRGTGEITIIQRQTGYRLPAVITESQFNKYSGITNVNNYYTRGSNGYIYTSTTDRKPDTSTKYILNYTVNTADTANAPNAGGTGVPKLAEDFRQAEKITLSIYAGAVKIDGTQLIVELTGTNALQVPGATYSVYYPAGFVQDVLNNPCPAVGTPTAPLDMDTALSGIAKPFIRINKRQDSITTQTGTASNPSLVATQPFQADVRMDSRTPGAAIFYIANQEVTTTNGMNWNYNNNSPNDLNTPAAPARPGDPQNTTTNRNEYTAPFTIGTANDYQGLQWYVRARARNSSTGSVWSSQDSEEMAYKTVITYVIPETMNAQDNGIGPGNGDQIWIRGGDAVGLSSVPGFPINWDVAEFESARLEKRRAGIRLFTKTNNGNLNSDAIWKFVTWEINVDTYLDLILGRDRTSDTNFAPVSTANEAWQYGPRQFAYQRAGWTSYKEQFRALPGKHRWLVSNNPTGNNTKGYLNFSGTFGARAQYTGANITITP
jgi:hypothetical protein